MAEKVLRVRVAPGGRGTGVIATCAHSAEAGHRFRSKAATPKIRSYGLLSPATTGSRERARELLALDPAAPPH